MDGLPPSVGAIAQLNGISKNVNLYNTTADYKYRSGFGNTFGYYVIAGGGWYYRHASISKSTFIPTTTVCQPIWYWYGYTCSDGYVNTVVGRGDQLFQCQRGCRFDNQDQRHALEILSGITLQLRCEPQHRHAGSARHFLLRVPMKSQFIS
jgi:hypothetical protein